MGHIAGIMWFRQSILVAARHRWLWESDMAEIMDAVHKNFALLPDAEVSVECNPGTVTAQKFAVYRQSGINRISLGLQSAQNVELKMLGRIHTWEQFFKNL